MNSFRIGKTICRAGALAYAILVLGIYAPTAQADTPSSTLNIVTELPNGPGFPFFWLEELTSQQSIAHGQVAALGQIRSVSFFDESVLDGTDIVYLYQYSLAQPELAASEIDSLENFVLNGGRLIMVGDGANFGASNRMESLANRFGASFGGHFFELGIFNAPVLDQANPITGGIGGPVSQFGGLGVNGAFVASNPAIRILASWNSGKPALSYLEFGLGEVVFLTDFNTFDNAQLALLDNQALWTNLFTPSESGPPNNCISGQLNCPSNIAVILILLQQAASQDDP